MHLLEDSSYVKIILFNLICFQSERRKYLDSPFFCGTPIFFHIMSVIVEIDKKDKCGVITYIYLTLY